MGYGVSISNDNSPEAIEMREYLELEDELRASCPYRRPITKEETEKMFGLTRDGLSRTDALRAMIEDRKNLSRSKALLQILLKELIKIVGDPASL